jgi:PAS domain S-box-containing protein
MSIKQSNIDFSGAGRVPIIASSFMPWLIMLIGLLVTFGIWHLSNRDITRIAQERFDVRAAQIVTAVEQRMHAYEQVLRGGVGLFRTATTITRQQWHEYVENANMARNYPGIQNMAVDFPIAAAKKSVHIATIRAEGHADYSILPEQPERPVYHSLVYVEPFGGRNLRAFGFDMYTSEVRRKAMDRAIDSGLPSISGVVKLAQETNKDVQHGFIYCLPVYRAGSPLDTPEFRRASLRALVCGAFRATDLMQSIFGNSNSDLELEIFDEAITPTSQMYDSRHGDKSTTSRFSRTTSAEIGGRTWQLHISANQAYVDSISFTQSRLVAVAGVMLSSLLFILMRSMFNTRINARRIAVTLNSIGDAVVATDVEARVTLINPLAEKLTGWRKGEAMGLPVDEVIRIVHEGTRLPAVNPVKDVLAHGTARGLANHTLIVARDGSECAIADSCAPILDSEGKVAGAVLVFRDVTEEYATQQALRDSEGRARFALHMTQTGAWDVNLADHTSQRTQEHDHIFGYDSHLPWSYEIFLEHVLPEDRAEMDRQFHAAIATQETWSFQCRVLRGDGEVRWIWGAGEPQFNSAGTILRIAGVIQDITTRHQAEEVLRKSEERFKTMFMQAPFGIAVIDSLRGNFCEVNQQYLDIAGRSMQEMLKIDWMQITHPGDLKDNLDKMALLNAGTINGFQMEKRYLHPNGEAVWIDMTVLKLNFDDTAHPLHFCIIQDTTKRKQNEAEQKILDQQLHDHQFYTRSLIESNFDAIMTTDQFGIITDVNKQMETLTGSTRDELIGSPSNTYFTDPDRAYAFIRQVLTEKKVTNFELTCLDRDGKETLVSYNATPLYDRDRKLKGVIAAARLNNLS